MIKTALNVYKKNIWEVFAIIGIVALGLFAGLGIAIPAIMNSTRETYRVIVDQVTQKAKEVGAQFNANEFLKSLGDQFKALDWANPIQTITNLFKDNSLFKIVGIAFEKAGLKGDQITAAVAMVKSTIDGFTNDVTKQVWIVVASVGVAALLSYILTKIVIRFRSTRYHHAGWFILSLLLNIINLALVYFIAYLISTRITNKVGFCFALFGNGLLMYILTFLNALLCYKPKEVKTRDILNVKNMFTLFFANLIMLVISVLVIMVVGIFSDAIAILISIPLLLIVSVISECVVISYTEQITIYYIIKKGLPMPKQFVKKDAEVEFIKKIIEKEQAKASAKK